MKSAMRQFGVVLAVLFIGIAWVGCGGGSDTSDDGSDSDTAITARPTAAELNVAIAEANPAGFAVGKALSPVTFPACTAAEGAEITYSINDLPSWLSFDSSTRILTLADGYSVVPNDAFELSTVSFDCSVSTASASVVKAASESAVEFVLNDLDGGGISDGYEYVMGRTPLVNRSFGWIWQNDDNVAVYAPEAVPTGLVLVADGLNAADADDEGSDLDGDGSSNLAEIEAGTNIFVPSSSGTFDDEVQYAVNVEPQGIDCADYDGDGAIDLAVTNRASNKLSILMGDGDGTFGAKSDTAQGNDPFGVISADFDGDGYLDLAITNSAITDRDISIRLGNGNGTFGDRTDYSSGTYSRYVYATTDFDGDGYLDLAVTNANDDNVAILLGNGDGSFDDPATYGVGDGPIGLVAADFDNDGDIDLASANDHVTTTSVLLNDGDGTFADAVDYVSGTNPWGVTAADYNGDFIIDLAVANYNGGNVSVLLGVGDGTFGSAVTYSTTTNPTMIVSADFNGDGAIDLAAACREDGGAEDTGQVSVLLGVGDGTFGAKVDYASTGDPINLCTADFDGDGLFDIATVNYQGDSVSILMGRE